MAHYISDLIKRAEEAETPKKEELEKECFEAILKLWRHRNDVPWRKPTEPYEKIFSVLEKLHNEQNVYSWYLDEQKLDKSCEKDQWIQLAASVDFASQSLIRWCLAHASDKARGEDPWLKARAPEIFVEKADFQVVRILINDADALLSEDERLEKQRQKKLEQIRGNLDWFIDVSKQIKKDIDKKLKQ